MAGRARRLRHPRLRRGWRRRARNSIPCSVYAPGRGADWARSQMFADPSLSASGRMSCATCHNPGYAFGPANGLSVQLGGKDMRQSGLRAVPSLGYLQATPPFAEHFFDGDDEGDDSVDNGPTGGLTWDGRVDRGRDQARIPLLSPYEMANRESGGICRPPASRPDRDEFQPVFRRHSFRRPGQGILCRPRSNRSLRTERCGILSLQQQIRCLSGREGGADGAGAPWVALFEDPAKGNCSRCHFSERGNDGTPPQFTDYGLIALGVPRNAAIPANSDPACFDLGMCGPLRDDFAEERSIAGGS